MVVAGPANGLTHHGERIRRLRGLFAAISVFFVVACGSPRPAARGTTVVEPAPPPTTPAPSEGSVAEPKTEPLGPRRDEEVPPAMQVHLIDVGQGAATLLEFSCGAVLIDTGGEMNDDFSSTEKLMAYLGAFFKRRSDLNDTLELLLITHPHIDHARGIKSVWDAYHVKNVVTDGLTKGSGGVQQANLIKWAKKAKIGLVAIKAKAIPEEGLTDDVIDPVKCDDQDPDIRVLWGAVAKKDVKKWPQKEFDNANNHSVVVKVTFGKSSLLVTGDLEEHGIEALVAEHGSALDADVYQVGHHGSHNATSKELLEAISPKIAIIGVGSPTREQMWTAWKYGHPRLPAIELLEGILSGTPRASIEQAVGTAGETFEKRDITAPIFATGWDGDIQLTLFANGSIGVNADP